ncbi:MAG: TonB-dependent receptor [Sphingomonas sp.]|nr:TonB-dependent receptor [Sphingomonas sp.]
MTKRISTIAVLLCTTATGTAFAQNVQTTAVQAQSTSDQAAEVVVTGVRQSLKTSTAVKRNAPEVVDSISSDDIGKLPDLNVGETLTRVPGVQAYRFGGEAASPAGVGSGLTIRGLSGQTASRVDGRAYFTAGQREFNVEGASPGTVAGIDVYKNPSAEHIEGAIGGLINIRTRQPLDFKGTTATVAVGGHYNDLGKKLTPDVFMLGSSRWRAGDGEMGLLLSGNYSKTFNRGDNDPNNGGASFRRVIAANSAEYIGNAAYNQSYAGRSDVSVLVPVANPTTLTAAQRANVISAIAETNNANEEDYMRTRKGVSASFQWRPSAQLEFYIDGTYNDYLYHQRYRFLNTADSPYVQNLVTIPFTVDEELANRNANGGANDVLASARLGGGTFLNSGLSTTGGEEHHRYQTGIIATGFKWKPTDHLDANFDFAYIKARQLQDNRAVTMLAKSGQTWNLNRDLTTKIPQLQIAGPDLANPATWVFGQYNNGTNQIWHDNGVSAALDLKYRFDAGFLKDIKVGARYATQRDRYNNYSYTGKNLTTNGLALAGDQSNAIPVTAMQDLTEFAPSNFQLGQAGYPGGFMVFSSDDLTGNQVRGRFANAGIPANDAIPENLLNRRFFSEKTYAGYAVADFGLLNDIVTGNVGVRVVKTDTFVRAQITDVAGGTPIIRPNSTSSSYTDVLPTVNLKAQLTDKAVIRFGYGKGITRPDLGSLNPTIIVNPTNGTGGVGNPDLKPQRADSYDVTFEYYQSPVSYASIDFFYKRIDGFFSGISTCQTVPTATPYNQIVPNGCTGSQYFITQTVNAARGTAKGVETAVQTFFDYPFLPDFMHKFGASGSFTYADTKNPLVLNGVRTITPQPLTSKYNYTLAGFFDNGKISARVVYTWRSAAVLGGVSPNPLDGRYFKAYGLLDASVTLKLPRNFSLALTVANITNNAPDRYAGELALATGILRQHFVNGRNFGATLRYTFGG